MCCSGPNLPTVRLGLMETAWRRLPKRQPDPARERHASQPALPDGLGARDQRFGTPDGAPVAGANPTHLLQPVVAADG
jgi:hypothetical protein